ncbi:uroporphyrinogen-III synthase [Aliifodinibius sp. S!AR15-10]|uniref:uroporphyrinogen-III synthase n=1 Tax=Aliifodinibius sp. S!AR15-10 TaxID=2950437 RepID=UPI002857887E|nr:uroporphyrinogen-III synthase [Aliifodinibius sp. S!AR15-10]MDR8392477.1 uroporphyrinogen-III synthase [Aliifodinibius sp. S!AR15-10]
MRHDKHNILVTRPLSGQQIEYARVMGLNPIIEPALEFEFPQYWDDVLRVINEHPKAEWVFTSANGVKALEQLMESGLQVRPETQLFAVGSKTREALQELGLESKVPVIQDALHLAELIADEGKVESVIYFHGNLSRDELSNGLEKEGIAVTEIEVYKTIINEVYLPEEPISAILFYSPSAVEGFKKGAGFEDSERLPVLFAIGPTTGEALEQASGQAVEIADQPSTETLLRNVSHYLFSKEKV